MSMVMIRSTVRAENAADVEAAATEMFTAIAGAAPPGVRYASCRLLDGLTYIAFLEVADGGDNPLFGVPEFGKFQENLKDWLAGPPIVEWLTTVGSYRLF